MIINKLYILVVSVFFAQLTFAQQLQNGDDEYVLTKDSLSVKDKLDVSTQISFGAGASNNGTYLSTSIRPIVSYRLTPKFSVYTGVGYTNYQLDNFKVLSEYGFQPFSGNLSQMTAFVGGKYQVNDRLAVRGEVFYNLAQMTPLNANFRQPSAFDNIGYAASFEYKVVDNMYIEGQIRINDFNRGPGMYNSFTNHGFGSGSFMRESSLINTMPYTR